MLGKKRYFKVTTKNESSKSDSNLYKISSFNSKSNNCYSPKINKNLINLYNMERSICLNCVKTKNKKYQTNTYIPCMPFSQSSL